jgi:diadenosine tetraphosphate (Ap4A) HIT family hydrolase
MSGLVLVPETVIRRGAVWSVAVNRNQDLIGKTMIVLERPCSAVIDLHPSEWADPHAELRQLVPALTRRFAPDQFNFALLMNQDAQVHLHVLPRYRSQRTWQGRIFADPNWGSAAGHEQRPLPLDELAGLVMPPRRTTRTSRAAPDSYQPRPPAGQT